VRLSALHRNAALITGVTIAAYLPSFSGAFLWDDNRYVTKPALRSLHGLGRIWIEPGAAEQYYPLLHSWFWLQHRLWGDHPLGYHLATVALHALAAILFAQVLIRLKVPGAWWSAALFALHPVHVESVAWIAEQKNTLSLVFFVAAALAYVRFDEERRPSWYWGALALFGCAVLSKTVTVTLPVVLLVIAWWRRGQLGWRRDAWPLLPWFAVGAAGGAFSSWVERHFLGAEGVAFSRPFAERLVIAGKAVVAYLIHLVWPVGLSFVYPHWTARPEDWAAWLPLLAVIALGVALWLVRDRNRGPLAAYLIFIGTLLPALGFVNLYGSLYSQIWDHWQYLPDLAPIALAGAGLVLLRSAARPAGLIVVAVLGILAFVHAQLFADNETLYRATLARSPDSWMAENNLATTLDRTGRTSEAVDHFRRALALNPDRPEYVHINLGIALGRMGKYSDALQEYQAAIAANPHEPNAYNQIGILLATQGRTADAVPFFQAALKENPPDAERMRYRLGLALSSLGKTEEALQQFAEAVRLDPNDPEAQTDRGIALGNLGRIPEAVEAFRAAVRLRPQSPDAHENLSEALKALGQNDEAGREAAVAAGLRH
jgi:Flp pilus assembly protein TadD